MLIGHRNDKIVKAVEERSKDSDTSCCREMLLAGTAATVSRRYCLIWFIIFSPFVVNRKSSNEPITPAVS